MADELPISAARADQHIVVKRCEVVRIQANRPHIHGRSPTRRTAFYSAPPCHGGVFDFRARKARLSTNIGAVSARNADDLRSTALRAGTYLPPGTESSNPPSSSGESVANSNFCTARMRPNKFINGETRLDFEHPACDRLCLARSGSPASGRRPALPADS